MLRVAGLLLTVIAVAGCGGSKSSVAKHAVPCLRGLGQYVHHTPGRASLSDATPSLPLADPESHTFPRRLAVPKDFQEYGEISYPPAGRGANAVQLFIFGSDALPKRISASFTTGGGTGRFAPRGVVTQLVGQTFLLWSSLPTAGQRSRVVACLR